MQHINIFTKTRWLVTILVFLALSVGNAFADVKLEFTTGTNDGSQLITNNDKANFMTSATKDLCTISSITRAYYYSSKTNKYGGPRGIKVGKSSSPTDGTVTFSLASGSQITSTSIVVEASRYGSDKAADLSIAVNGGSTLTAQALQDATVREYTFNFSSTTVTSITINTSKYAYIKSITVKTPSSTCSTAPSVADPENGSFFCTSCF